MRFDILTIFPEFFRGPFDYGIIKRAIKNQIVDVRIHDLRSFTYDKHQIVDDRPFGGGEGMVLKPEPIFRAVEAVTAEARSEPVSIVLLSPQGRIFNQREAERLAAFEQVVLICGRYEGVDERVVENLITDEISIGDFILTGGEVPAIVIVDAVTRLLPKSLGCEVSSTNESFSGGILDHPQYTRPAVYRGMAVPEILLSGNHAEIARWRRRKALEKTLQKRPDLLSLATLSDWDRQILEQIKKAQLK